jgi:uncharacterized protein (DUF302 family)
MYETKFTFGVETDLDLQAARSNACNPKIAHQAFQHELEIGAVLPCNVIVYENDKGGTNIGFMDPKAAFGMVGIPGLEEFAGQVTDMLKRVAGKL